MTTLPWHVEPGYEGEQLVGYVLRNEAGESYEQDGATVTWFRADKAQLFCNLINAGVEL